MARLTEVARRDVHAGAKPVFQMIFGDADPASVTTGTGTPGDWWTVFAGVPDIFDHAVAGFTLYQQPARRLDPALRELGQMRAGYACGSRFVFSQHCKAARDARVTEAKISAIPSWTVADCFSPIERAVLAYTDALALEHGRVSDNVFDALRAGLDDAAILELTYVVSMYIMHAGMSRALRLEYDDVPEPVSEVPAPDGRTGLAETLHDPGEGT